MCIDGIGDDAHADGHTGRPKLRREHCHHFIREVTLKDGAHCLPLAPSLVARVWGDVKGGGKRLIVCCVQLLPAANDYFRVSQTPNKLLLWDERKRKSALVNVAKATIKHSDAFLKRGISTIKPHSLPAV